MLTKQPSAAVDSSRTAESASPPKSGSGGSKRSGSRKKVGAKRMCKAIKKPEKAGRRSKAGPSLGQIKITIPVSSTIVSTAGASTSASYAPDVNTVKMDDDGALTIPLRSLSRRDSFSNL